MAASAPKSACATPRVQAPSPFTVAVFAPVKKPLTLTVALASPVPVRVKPASCSALLRRLSVETAATVGASGAFVSTVIAPDVIAAPTFPARSV